MTDNVKRLLNKIKSHLLYLMAEVKGASAESAVQEQMDNLSSLRAAVEGMQKNPFEEVWDRQRILLIFDKEKAERERDELKELNKTAAEVNLELKRKTEELKGKLDKENALVWRLLKQVKELKRKLDECTKMHSEAIGEWAELEGHVMRLKRRLEGGHARHCLCGHIKFAHQDDDRCLAYRKGEK